MYLAPSELPKSVPYDWDIPEDFQILTYLKKYKMIL